MASDADVAAFAQSVLADTGAPDLFLNNAPVITANAPVWEVSAEEFSRVVDVNLKGVGAMIRPGPWAPLQAFSRMLGGTQRNPAGLPLIPVKATWKGSS